MSAIFRCDGPDCGKTLEKDTARIEVAAVTPLTDEQKDDGLIAIAIFEAERHFCSMACLSAWAYTQALESAG